MRGAGPGLVERLVRFAGALRAEGVRLGVGDEIDGANALAVVDLLDRAEVHRALRIALKLPRESWDLFDRLFAEHWGGAPAPRRAPPPQPLPRDHRGPMQWQWDGQRVRLAVPEEEDEAPQGDKPAYSPEPMLRRKPFDRCSRSEIAQFERMLQTPRSDAQPRPCRFAPQHATVADG